MKKFFKYLGFALLSIVLFFVVIGVLASFNNVDKEAVFEPYILETIPELTSWDQSSYKNLLSEEGFNSLTSEQWKLYLNKLSNLGVYQTTGKPELLDWKTLSPVGGSKKTFAVYQVPVTFSTGLAHVKLSLQYSEDKVQINSLKFQSNILMK